jgi:hypothetical protein
MVLTLDLLYPVTWRRTTEQSQLFELIVDFNQDHEFTIHSQIYFSVRRGLSFTWFFPRVSFVIGSDHAQY